MKDSRRMRRMSRNRNAIPTMSLTSLMDIFTIMVFFLLVNSASTEVLQTPKQITLPASTVEDKPRETIVIFVSPEQITVQGEIVALVADVLGSKLQSIPEVGEHLARLDQSVIGLNTRTVSERKEVTLLVDKAVPFQVVKKVMSTCTGQGFERISLAVLQKAGDKKLAQS